MIRWSSKHIVLVSSLFLASFLGAISIKGLCDLGVINQLSDQSHSHDKSLGVDGHDQTEHDHGTNHQQNLPDHQSSSDLDKCCDDLAGSFDSSLYITSIKSSLPLVKFFMAGKIEFSSIRSLYFTYNTFYHEFDDPPPLIGSDLRVVIQSFII